MRERTSNRRTSNPSHSSPALGTKTTGDSRIPKKTARPDPAAAIKSFVRKILLTSPMFPGLYADVARSAASNSNESNTLDQGNKKIIATTERTSKPMSTSKSCMHIKVSGVRCGSPALRGEQFCYFHQRMLRTVRYPSSRVHHAALLEDEESIQASLVETVNALLRGTIELKRAELILRALNTAVRNIRRVHFGLHASDMVKELPDYPAVPDPEVEEAARLHAERQAIRADFDRQQAAYRAKVNAAPAQTEKAPDETAEPSKKNVGTAVVGTAAPGCPGGPAVPGRSAVATKPTATPAAVVARKPPLSVKVAAPKERKIAAH